MKGFEVLSGIKINLTKAEMFLINVEQDFLITAASLFGCAIGKFSLKYLGLSLHTKKLSVKDWDFLIYKIDKTKLQSWKG